jgi:chemotaxis protein histidine kinase CheA
MSEKTAAEIVKEQRERIKVTSVTVDDPDTSKMENTETENQEAEVTADDENNDAESIETTTEAEAQTEVEETEGEVEASEEKQAELEKAKKEAATKEEKDKIQRRIDREVAKRKALEQEIADLKKKLEAQPDKNLTEEEVEKRAEEKANAKNAEKEFVNACNRLAEAGTKLDDKFNEKIQDLAEDIGPIPGMMIGILDDLENGAAVLKHLTEDHDLAEKIYGMTPAKMGVELAKLGSKIAKPAAKQISKAPTPPNNLGGGSRKSNIQLNDKMSDKEWIERRNQQLREKGKFQLL